MTSSQKHVPETNPGAKNLGTSLQVKKGKNIITELIPDTIEWFLNNSLWLVIGGVVSKAKFKL